MLPSFITLCLLFLPKATLSDASSLSQSSLPTTAKISSSGVQETLTAAPTLSCYPRFQDPDLGILSPFCVCNGTESLPQITPTSFEIYNDLTESCAYETIPVSEIIPLTLTLAH